MGSRPRGRPVRCSHVRWRMLAHVNRWVGGRGGCNDVPDDFKNVALLMFKCTLLMYLAISLPKSKQICTEFRTAIQNQE